MEIYSRKLEVPVEGYSGIENITDQVRDVATESGFREGMINIYSIGSTASISTIEFEPALVQDFKDKLEEFFPHDRGTRHGETWGDDNGFSHIRATMMGPGITVPLHEGSVVVGTWQQIIVINHDNRDRARPVFVQVIGQ